MSALTRWEPVMTRWNPFKDLENMEQRLSTYLGRPAVRTEAGKEAMTVAEWSPLVDITEDDKEYLIKADLPEVKKEDVKLTVQDDVMSISGERKYEKEADGSKVSAEYKEGVLNVHLPKSEKAKPKSIEVKVS
jgi:HSP20 family protein